VAAAVVAAAPLQQDRTVVQVETDSQSSLRFVTHEIRNHSIEHRSGCHRVGRRCAVVTA